MSCQMPAMPASVRTLYLSAHQARAAGAVKSGKATRPGHTTPSAGRPDRSTQKW